LQHFICLPTRHSCHSATTGVELQSLVVAATETATAAAEQPTLYNRLP
jgi:hypothetical protein